MRYRKTLLLAVTFIAALIVILLLINKGKSTEINDFNFYVSKYAPQSLGYFRCTTEGIVEGNLCDTCEKYYQEAVAKIGTGSGAEGDPTYSQVVNYVKSQDLNCVNHSQGGN